MECKRCGKTLVGDEDNRKKICKSCRDINKERNKKIGKGIMKAGGSVLAVALFVLQAASSNKGE